MSRRFGLQAVLLLLAIGLFIGIQAQVSTTGNITGTVRDPQGAVVPKAEITIVDDKTGASRTVTANDDGFYNFSSVPAGTYSISASPSGFKKTVVTGVDLHVNENKTVNLELQVGQVSEVVTITSEAAQIETRSGEVSSLVSEKQVTELPLNGRNYAQLALMVPGISPVTQAGAGGAFTNKGTGLDSGIDMSVNGNQSNANLWTVDGVNNVDVGSNRTLIVFPSIDSIQEFRVERNSFSAEFGQAQGAVINLITKGGSNTFHGGAFEFYRNDSLNANSFFLNRAGQPKPQLNYNNYGFNISGPVYLPRFGEGGPSVRSAKNRAFFFWSEEWRRERRGTVLSANVPTAAEKRGDFSAPRNQLTGQLPHLPGQTCDPNNPANYGPNPASPGCFPGNKIPTAQLSPGGLAFVKLFPDPTGPGPGGWATSTLQPVDTRQDSIRGDVTLTDKMNLMVRYINEKWTHGTASGNFWGDSPYPTLSSDWNQPSHSFAVKLTNTLSSKAVNDFQFSIAGNDIVLTSNDTKALEDEIASKIPTVFPHTDGRISGEVPSLFWGAGGYANIWHHAPWQNREDLYIWKDDFSIVFGSHDLKFGGLYSYNFKDEPAGGAGGGNQTATIQGCGLQTDNCIADLLLKDTVLVNYTEIVTTEIADGRWRDYEFYGNDTWKVRPHVTLTMGLRYSAFPAAWAADNHISNFIPSLYNGIDFNTGLVTADEGSQIGLGRSLVHTYKQGWQPRFGLAWDVFGTGKTAVRAGFGRYISRKNVIEDMLRLSGNPPWTTTVSAGSGWNGAGTTLANCPSCRSLDTINPGLATHVAGVDPNAGFAAVDPNYRPPESYQWNLTISHELLKDTVLEASYIGNHGLHIWRRNVNRNDIAPNQACRGTACDGSTASARLQIARAGMNVPSPIPGVGVQNQGQLIADNRLYRGIGNVSTSESTGDSSYHAMQLWLNRRFTKRLAFQAQYTWSHAISNGILTSFTNSVSDPFNFNNDKGDADLDRRQTFVGNVVYELPSFNQWGRPAHLILGDWQVNAIVSYFGATPIEITDGVNTLGTASAVGQRPNYTGAPLYLHTADKTRHLNPAAFATPAPGQLGSLGKGSVRGTAISTVDFSFAKNWRIKERYGIQFRTEFFNLLNHTNFVGFDTDTRNTTFGTLNVAQSPREIQLGIKFTF
jgi:hypothetical protein